MHGGMKNFLGSTQANDSIANSAKFRLALQKYQHNPAGLSFFSDCPEPDERRHSAGTKLGRACCAQVGRLMSISRRKILRFKKLSDPSLLRNPASTCP
jgi:hypothetical protein